MKPVRILTDYQKKFIEENYRTMTHEEIANHLGFTSTWIDNYCSKLGLHKRQRSTVAKEETKFFNVHQKWSWI